MSSVEVINALLLKPIQLFFEIIYMLAYEITENPGISIIALSLVMNFLLLPLYNRADKIQEEERNIENKLHDGVSHIKKTFRGDERMMILQTYYRQNNYKPTYVLRGAISLFLEIPFFMAAYSFLSHLELLQGVSFGPISNLGVPDAMFTVAGVEVNVLPILMTLINLVSSVLYTQGSPLKVKVQLYVMAGVFLVILYASPAGLVLYWTMNNIFSLVKTLFGKMRNPGKNVKALVSLAGIFLFIYSLVVYPPSAFRLKIYMCVVGVLMQVPFILEVLKIKIQGGMWFNRQESNRKMFFASGSLMAVLTGILIPSAVLAASPQEFVDIGMFYHPLWYICNSASLSIGTFIIWIGVFYGLAKNEGKKIIEVLMIMISVISIIDYMFFGKSFGLINSTLKYDNGLSINFKDKVINFVIIVFIVVGLMVVLKRWKKQLYQILLVACIVLVCMSAINIVKVNQSIKKLTIAMQDSEKDNISFHLSKTGKNVIVVMLDRAFGGYTPYIMNEKPKLKEKFDGFTYYSNVISYGAHSNFGGPALYGGYEYTPLEMNKRKNEKLVDKHNEALKVMPTIFSQNGFEVTVSDPSYANYQIIPDLSIFKDIPNVRTFITMGKFTDIDSRKQAILSNKRNFFCFGILKTLPLVLQNTFYEDGRYRQSNYSDKGYVDQTIYNSYKATGIEERFMAPYSVLEALPKITKIVDDNSNQFLLFANDTTHEPMMLQEPEYEPKYNIDNTLYEKENENRFSIDGKTLQMNNWEQYAHYQVNVAAYQKLAEWFDYLRENDVYDNTRIILVADHGFSLKHFEELMIKGVEDLEFYYPLLMVKDFNSKGFTISDKFMTNGDVPTLAVRDVINRPINPYTGKEINSEYKNNEKQFICGSHEWNIEKNNGNVFLPSVWYSIHDNIWKKDNWELIEDEQIFLR